MNKRIIIAVVSAVLLITVGLLFTQCEPTCNGTDCRKAVGVMQKPSVCDSNFRKEHPKFAINFKVYVESSASMDGYVSGNTDFKTMLHRVIGQVTADVVEKSTDPSLFYINTEIIPRKSTPKQFTNALSPSSFAAAGGDRTNSDIMEIIENVIKSTPKGEVSMFVSDCVYSPEPAADIAKALAKQQTDMRNALQKKSKSDPEFGVVLYRLISDFHGIYYNKTNDHISCDGPRPYFIWFFGDASILATVADCLSGIMTEAKAQFLVGIPGYGYLPYRTLGSAHPYHYIPIKANDRGFTTIRFIADLSAIPCSEAYITDKANYICAGKNYSIDKVTPYNDKKYPSFNYQFTLRMNGRENSHIASTVVEISLKSMLHPLPKWVTEYDDPAGADYDKGYRKELQRTFGLKSLAEGIAEFYKEKTYCTFKIKVN